MSKTTNNLKGIIRSPPGVPTIQTNLGTSNLALGGGSLDWIIKKAVHAMVPEIKTP